MDNKNLIVRIGIHKISDPTPRHDFSKLEGSEYARVNGIVAASQNQLNEQIKSKLRLDPNAKEIRYFYYEVADG